MVIIGILMLIGIYSHSFLNRPEPGKPAIAVYEQAPFIATILILVGIILFLIRFTHSELQLVTQDEVRFT